MYSEGGRSTNQFNKKFFSKLVRALHRWLYGVALDYHCLDLDLQKILLALDGLVARLSRGAAVVLCDRCGTNLRIRLPIDGNTSEILLYRSELRAILGSFLLLTCLIPPALQKNMRHSVD